MLNQVIKEVEEQCREERFPMLGPDKATLLASCVEKAKPSLIVKCRTAIGYSGLVTAWRSASIAANGRGGSG